MKEPHRKGIAIHPDPESCASRRKVAGEALTGAHVGQVLSSEICLSSGVPTSYWEAEGNIGVGERSSLLGTLRSHRPRACVETPGARTGRPQERPSPVRGGPVGEGHEPEV
jgi:hypothetical protein